MNSPAINKNTLLNILQGLIQINSVNPGLSKNGKGEGEISKYIGNILSKMGLQVKSQKLGANRVNVIGILKGTGKGKTIMLNGHTDTVGISGMKIDPFEPTYKDGMVYGRGSIDMKGGLAGMIVAVDGIINSQIKLKGDVILTFVADEEDRSVGMENIATKYTADAAIVCEPTNMEIGIAHKGFAWIKIEVFGKAAHGSEPSEGVDAIIKAGKVLCEIEEFGKNILLKREHPLLGAPSIHASIIEGGKEISTYPDYCKIELERRSIPGETRETISNELNSILENIKSRDKEFQYKADIFYDRPPHEVSRDEPIVKALMAAYKTVLGEEPRISGLSYWTDAAILRNAGIPSVLFGPSGKGLHAAIEYVDFDSLIQHATVLADTIAAFCGEGFE